MGSLWLVHSLTRSALVPALVRSHATQINHKTLLLNHERREHGAYAWLGLGETPIIPSEQVDNSLICLLRTPTNTTYLIKYSRCCTRNKSRSCRFAFLGQSSWCMISLRLFDFLMEWNRLSESQPSCLPMPACHAKTEKDQGRAAPHKGKGGRDGCMGETRRRIELIARGLGGCLAPIIDSPLSNQMR